ncbi:hypothetical protein RUM43_010162 [Polyplax serrata]|uniref:Uncharacterized protein n=1 Tax=Polyplax serrata TaxID=468196 RepID=A0AAN8PK76_POLSC
MDGRTKGRTTPRRSQRQKLMDNGGNEGKPDICQDRWAAVVEPPGQPKPWGWRKTKVRKEYDARGRGGPVTGLECER